MYVHTKLANGCVVTEIATNEYGSQHIIETCNGYIISVCLRRLDKTVTISAILNVPRYYNLINRLVIPTGNYKALRAALQAFIALAPLHERSHVRVY